MPIKSATQKAIAALSASVLFFLATPAFACDCIPETPEQFRARVDRVVTSPDIEVLRGRALSIRRLGRGVMAMPGTRLVEVRLRVEQSTRGPAQGAIIRVQFRYFSNGPDSCTSPRPPIAVGQSLTLVEDTGGTVQWLFPEGCTADVDTFYAAVQARLTAATP